MAFQLKLIPNLEAIYQVCIKLNGEYRFNVVDIVG
jgi:hypothetical protein